MLPTDQLVKMLAYVDNAYRHRTPSKCQLVKADIIRTCLASWWIKIAQIKHLLELDQTEVPIAQQVVKTIVRHLASPCPARINLEKELQSYQDAVAKAKTILEEMPILPSSTPRPSTSSSSKSMPNTPTALDELDLCSVIVKGLLPPNQTDIKIGPIIDPADEEEDIVEVNLAELSFKGQIICLLLKNGNLPWKNFTTVAKLRKHLPQYRDAIHTIFESALDQPRHLIEYCKYDWDYLYSRKKSVVGLTVEQVLQKLDQDKCAPWTNLDPITCDLRLVIPADSEGHENELQKLKSWTGPRTWSCYADCSNYISEPVECTRKMALYLAEMPHLKKLIVCAERLRYASFTGHVEPQRSDWEQVDAIQMPALECLKTLVLWDSNVDPSARTWMLHTKILKSCHQSLTRLVVNAKYFDWSESRPPVKFPALPPFPHLTWCAFASGPNQGWELHRNLLEMLKGSPLKVVKLETWTDGNNKLPSYCADFPDVIKTLGKHFSKTLEDLTIVVRQNCGKWKRNEQGKWASDSFRHMSFPKLKRLAMNVDYCPETWDFLLMFPALETIVILEVDLYDWWEPKDREGIVDFNASLAKLRSSNVWKLLPKLEKVVVKQVFGYYQCEVDNKGIVPGSLTREECVGAKVEEN